VVGAKLLAGKAEPSSGGGGCAAKVRCDASYANTRYDPALLARSEFCTPSLELRMTKASNQARESLDANEQVRRLGDMFAKSPSFSALLQGPEHRFVLTNPAYQQLIGHRNVIGLTVREAIPEAERQGFIQLLDRVFATGERPRKRCATRRKWTQGSAYRWGGP
jgi:hypothetical protein